MDADPPPTLTDRRVRRQLLACCGFALSLLSATSGSGQTTVTDTLAEAHRLNATREFNSAIALLRTYVIAHEGNIEAAVLLAQTLYWAGDIVSARATFEAILERQSATGRARLAFARMLLETGDYGAARAVVEPLRTTPSFAAEAVTILGTLAYWQGDFTRARNLFREALTMDSTVVEAQRQLHQINQGAASWTQVRADLHVDDQPVQRVAADLRFGAFLTPLWSWVAGIRPGIMGRGESAPRRAVNQVELSTSNYVPPLRLETAMTVGLLTRSFGKRRDWTGDAVVGIRLPAQLRVRARAAREPYLHTTASLDVPTMSTATEVQLDLNERRGWIGSAARIQTRFEDANTVNSAYAWLLAPVVRREGAELRLGYAVSAQDAKQSRFMPAQLVDIATPAGFVNGRYAPYYTPERVLVHSVITSYRAGLGTQASRGAVYANGSIPVWATEWAPILSVDSARIMRRSFFSRRFSPWDAELAVETPIGSELTVRLSSSHRRRAYYSASTLSLEIRRRFAVRAPAGLSSR